MKRQIAGILTGLLVCSAFLAGCGKNEATQAVKESVETEKEGNGESTEAEGKDQDKKSDAEETDGSTEESSGEDQAPEVVLDKIGILLPEERSDMNGSLERAELKSRLEENGYDAALYFAKEDADTQISQIRELLQDENLKALVISPVDPYSLSDVLQEASDQSIPVIDYDDLIMDTDKIKYYVTFNTRAIGNEIGKNIVKQAELDKVREDRGCRTIEFLMGSLDDDASLFLFNGIMEVLGEYVEDGTLVCRSGRTTFDQNGIADENTADAMTQLNSVISEFYSLEKTPDIICTASDAFALAAMDILENEEIYPGDENWPLITGLNADTDAVKSVAEGKMGFTVMMDRRDLAEACATLVDTYLKGDDVEVSNYSQYDNGVKIIGTVTCDGKLIDKDNYQILVDNGFYLAVMIAPEASPTQIPEASPTLTPEVSPAPEEVSPTPAAEVTGVPEASPAPDNKKTTDGKNAAPASGDGPEITTEEVPSVKEEHL